MPLRSIITPMKTKVGTAVSTRFSATPPQMRYTMLVNSMYSNTPIRLPTMPNRIVRPASPKATGSR